MENPIMTITMADGGRIVCELYPEKAPQSVRNMIALANKGFYDGLIFHRVISGFMIQGGCPKGTGTGGPGYCIKGEFKLNGVKNNLSHKRGVVSMARAQSPNSAGSQFFIMHEDGEFLDGQYAAFGKVLEGMDVVDKIAADEYKTKTVVAFLAAVGAGKKNLIVNDTLDTKFVKSAANIPGVKTAATGVNTYDVVNADKLILSLDAAKKLEEVYA